MKRIVVLVVLVTVLAVMAAVPGFLRAQGSDDSRGSLTKKADSTKDEHSPEPGSSGEQEDAVITADNQALVDEIITKSNHAAYYQGKDGSSRVAMTITDNQGRARHREFTILRRDDESAEDDKDQKYYVYFHRPADVNKMVFLVWKSVNGDDDRWLYLPALDLVKRIASTEKRTSFVGSDFFYEDVSGRNLAADSHELVETSKNYYVLKNVPIDPASVEFSHYLMWIHRQTYLAVKVEYYDKSGEKYREYQALKVDTVQGYPTVSSSRMKDFKGGGNTVIEYSNIKYDIDIQDKYFTERYLRKAPRKYLR